MRHGRELRLVGWSVAVTAVVALLVASSASAVTASRTVALNVKRLDERA
jgi:hypothetical protein